MSVLERNSRNKGIIATVVVHMLLLILFLFMMAYQPPDPPKPSFGIVLNYGIDDAGSGEEQNEEQPSEEEQSEVQEQVEELEEVEEIEEVEELVEETEVVEEAEPFAEPSEDNIPVGENKPVEDITPKEEPKEEKKPVVKAKNAFDPSMLKNNNGNKTNKVGDQGNPEGDLNSKNYNGNPGSKDGASLEMAGWKWDKIPQVEDASDEVGKIVIKIKVDEDGYVIQATTIEKTVTQAVERKYLNEVRRLTFSKTNQSMSVAAVSTGTITFVIRSR